MILPVFRLETSFPLTFSLIFFLFFIAGVAITTAEGLQIRITGEEGTDVDPDTEGDQPGYKMTFVTEGESEFDTSDLDK